MLKYANIMETIRFEQSCYAPRKSLKKENEVVFNISNLIPTKDPITGETIYKNPNYKP